MSSLVSRTMTAWRCGGTNERQCNTVDVVRKAQPRQWFDVAAPGLLPPGWLNSYPTRRVSVEVNYDAVKKWVTVRVGGVLGLDDVLRLIGSARAGVEHRMWPMLFDARAATTTTTEQDVEAAVQAVAEALRSQGLRGHVALVADDDVLYARMLLYETRCAAAGVRVIRAFRERTDAERWLTIVSAARYFQ